MIHAVAKATDATAVAITAHHAQNLEWRFVSSFILLNRPRRLRRTLPTEPRIACSARFLHRLEVCVRVVAEAVTEQQPAAIGSSADRYFDTDPTTAQRTSTLVEIVRTLRTLRPNPLLQLHPLSALTRHRVPSLDLDRAFRIPCI